MQRLRLYLEHYLLVGDVDLLEVAEQGDLGDLLLTSVESRDYDSNEDV